MKITVSLAVLLAFGFLQIPCALADDRKNQPPPESVAAQHSNAAVDLTVVNRTAESVSLFWVAPDGRLTPYGTIAPGAPPMVQSTYSGHSWIFRSGHQVLKTYVVTSQPRQQVVIGGSAAPGMPQRTLPGVVIANQDPNDPLAPNGAAIHRRVPLVIPDGPGKNPVVVVPNDETEALDNTDPAVAEFLRVHNQARAAVGVPPLKWSTKLAQSAQHWADQLEATGQIRHNPAKAYGENIAAQTPPFSPASGARLWLEEKATFQPGQTQTNEVGHYTQMVWRNTTHVGFGVAEVNGMTVIVANYEPAGNITGQPPF